MRVAKFGFEVTWDSRWPVLAHLPRVAREGEIVTIFPGDALPADHPITLGHTGYFQ